MVIESSSKRTEFPALPNQNHTLLALLAGAAQGYTTQKAEKEKQQATLLANALPSLVKAGYDPSALMKKQGIDLGPKQAGYMDYETLKDQASYMKDMQDMADKQATRAPQTPQEWNAAIQRARAVKMIQDTVGYPVTMGPSGISYGKTDPFSNLLGGQEGGEPAQAFDPAAFQGIMNSLYPDQATQAPSSLDNKVAPSDPSAQGYKFSPSKKKWWKQASDGSISWL